MFWQSFWHNCGSFLIISQRLSSYNFSIIRNHREIELFLSTVHIFLICFRVLQTVSHSNWLKNENLLDLKIRLKWTPDCNKRGMIFHIHNHRFVTQWNKCILDNCWWQNFWLNQNSNSNWKQLLHLLLKALPIESAPICFFLIISIGYNYFHFIFSFHGVLHEDSHDFPNNISIVKNIMLRSVVKS